jgi:hypothetical protein
VELGVWVAVGRANGVLVQVGMAVSVGVGVYVGCMIAASVPAGHDAKKAAAIRQKRARATPSMANTIFLAGAFLSR